MEQGLEASRGGSSPGLMGMGQVREHGGTEVPLGSLEAAVASRGRETTGRMWGRKHKGPKDSL